MNATTVLIIALVCVVIGYAAGALMSYLIRPKASKEEEILSKRVQMNAGEDAERASHLLAGLWRDAPGAPLKVEIGGKVLTSAGELRYDQREHLENLVLELKSWLGYGPAPQPTPIMVPTPGAEEYPAEAAQEKPAAKPAQEEKPKATGPASIVDQVNDILQNRLAGSPLAAKGIRLAETPNQGVVVWVGLEHYEGIDAVPDPEVKALIRDAVKEWEHRYR